MSISIITPHFNDLQGIKQTHNCLRAQNSKNWEWIIVDDYSTMSTKETMTSYFKDYDSPNIKLILNDKKTTGSICRNIGVDYAKYEHIIFLDSDDFISEDFVSNRAIDVDDFVVFRNTNIIDEKGNNKPSPTATSNYLDCFLQAKFIWPITSVLWDKKYLTEIGKFNPDLNRLQDVELSIRALILSKNYKVLDNKVDFFYCVAPININKRPVNVICESVDYLIKYMHDNYNLNKQQRSLVTGYYYLCVRYFNRSSNKSDIKYVQNSLKLFYKKKYMSYFSYLRGLSFIKLYKFSLMSSDYFLRLNRYFYK